MPPCRMLHERMRVLLRFMCVHAACGAHMEVNPASSRAAALSAPQLAAQRLGACVRAAAQAGATQRVMARDSYAHQTAASRSRAWPLSGTRPLIYACACRAQALWRHGRSAGRHSLAARRCMTSARQSHADASAPLLAHRAAPSCVARPAPGAGLAAAPAIQLDIFRSFRLTRAPRVLQPGARLLRGAAGPLAGRARAQQPVRAARVPAHAPPAAMGVPGLGGVGARKI